MGYYAGKNIWIIGASSGIGAALAKALSEAGANLVLSARNKEALEKANKDCGGRHRIFALDAASEKEVRIAADQIAQEFPRLDSIIHLAAMYEPGAVADMSGETINNTILANLNASFYVAKAALSVFRAQGGGQLALCGSVAGYAGLPNGQPYSATKAGVISLAESLRAEEAANGIDVRLISPGFVRTRLTDKNDFAMPMMIEPEEAAHEIMRGLAGRGFEIHFPKKFTFLMKIIGSLPYALYFMLTRKMAERKKP